MNTRALILSFALISIAFISKAQVAINTSGAQADQSAILDISATDRGLLIPRVTLSSLTDNMSPVNNPAQGLLVYNIGGSLDEGFYAWTGQLWSSLASTGFVENTVHGLSGPVFGELYEFNEIGSYTTIDLTNDGSWHSWISATEGDYLAVIPSCTADQSRLTIDQEGYYQVSISFSYETASANVIFDAAVFTNDMVQNDLRTREQSNSAQVYQNCTISGIILLQVGDYLDLRFSASQNKELRLGTVNLSINKIG